MRSHTALTDSTVREGARTQGHPVLGAMLFLLCTFPFISPINTPFDTQPYATAGALAAILLLTLSRKRMLVPKQLLPFGLVLCFATVAWPLSPELMSGFRSLVGYLSVCAISLAAYVTFQSVKGKLLVYVVLVWLLFGLVQIVAHKAFGEFLLPRLSTSPARGVASLAVEPSYYSVMCVFFLLLNDIFLARKSYSRRTYLLVFGLTVVQIFFAQAALGIVLLFVYLAVRLITQGSLVRIFNGVALFTLIIATILLLFRYAPMLRDSRAGRLLAVAEAKGDLYVLASDASVNDRLLHILASHSAIFRGNLLGLGLGNWNSYADELVAPFHGYVPVVNVTSGGRIMSGWGAAIFELGLFGVLFLAAFVYVMYTGWRAADRSMKRIYISSAFTIYFVMLMAVPIAFPLFGYLLGVFVCLPRSGGYEHDARNAFQLHGSGRVHGEARHRPDVMKERGLRSS
jgi:hypothetical protein